MLRTCKESVLMLIVLTVLTGVLYPLFITGVAQGLFPVQANGSLIERDGKALGSALIGQPFSGDKYFWGRPSATSPMPYNAAASSGSNQGPLNPALADAVKERIAALHRIDPDNTAPIPVDLITASASGLDPHITPAAARYQIRRVSRARGAAPERLTALVDEHTEGRQFGFLGEARVHVLKLNLALDAMQP